ncbi:beta-ketoacyl synthase [Pseudomonas sp. CrR25]|nr:beta-ketoacyl synthase [Pseudomonas sp. CrR25]
MAASQVRPVYLLDIALLNAAGSSTSDLYGVAQAAQSVPFKLDRRARPIAAPRLASDLFDRKIQRSVEAQGLRLLHCAARLAPALQALQLPAERVALSAAIPEVDAPSPCWDAVEAIREQPDKVLGQLFANTPPLHALTLLNSSVMAYVAEGLRCNGPMGGYCSQGNAGVDALIEAVTMLAEARADAALVVSSSPNITPALYLREGVAYPNGSDVYGEGAAAALLATAPLASSPLLVRVAGWGRGYSASPERAAPLAERVLHQALRAERVNLNDIEQIVADEHDPVLRELFAHSATPHSSRGLTGDLGASALLTDIAYALGDSRHADVPCTRFVLLMTRSRAGHCGALLLEIAKREKGA